MAEPSRSRGSGAESDGGVGGRSSLLLKLRLAAGLWKIWAVGVLFLLIAWMAHGMQGLSFVVEPFYLLFALLAFGHGIRRLREKIQQSDLRALAGERDAGA